MESMAIKGRGMEDGGKNHSFPRIARKFSRGFRHGDQVREILKVRECSQGLFLYLGD